MLMRKGNDKGYTQLLLNRPLSWKVDEEYLMCNSLEQYAEQDQ